MANDLTASTRPSVALIALRVVLIAAGLGLWFLTQKALGDRVQNFDPVVAESLLQGDGILQWLTPAHQYLLENVQTADNLLILSSLLINVLAIYLFAAAIFGRSISPFLGLLILFALRQSCQVLSALPAPPELIWRQPVLSGFEPPGLLVTYGVANDFFFSGHTAIAVYGAIELARLRRSVFVLLGVSSAIFQIVTVLALRAHWTMDVYAGIATALLLGILAPRIAPAVDRLLERLASAIGGTKTV